MSLCLTLKNELTAHYLEFVQAKPLLHEQEKWLNLIRDHLVENLVIEEADFRFIPFSRYGGWKKANKVFDGKLRKCWKRLT